MAGRSELSRPGGVVMKRGRSGRPGPGVYRRLGAGSGPELIEVKQYRQPPA